MSQCDSINDNGRTFFVLITSRVKEGECTRSAHLVT